ncbi:hypothetical protein [Coleofasciculus sp. E2-BRE-01]|uniref:hypothetical protein n=1 Tax=Coleofasciculus sp. E2-BRE-01 TaxID=3069524 RepID=UPI0032F70D1F
MSEIFFGAGESASAAGIKILEQLRRYDEAGGAEGAGEAGGDISCSVISAFLH